MTNHWMSLHIIFIFDYISHDGSVCMPYMVSHLPSIYPSFVSIYTIHGSYGFVYMLPCMGTRNQSQSLQPLFDGPKSDPLSVKPSFVNNDLPIPFTHPSPHFYLLVTFPYLVTILAIDEQCSTTIEATFNTLKPFAKKEKNTERVGLKLGIPMMDSMDSNPVPYFINQPSFKIFKRPYSG